MTNPRIGVIGAGWWSTDHHMPSLRSYDKADFCAIAELKSAKLSKAADYFGIDLTFEDYKEMFATAKLDGVVIAVQHSYHYQIAKDALEAGLHVFVEKPMTLESKHAWDLVQLADSKKLHLMVGYTYHFSDHAQIARRLVQSGQIGEIDFISILYTSWVEEYLRGNPEKYSDAFEFRLTAPEVDSYSNPLNSGGGQGFLQVVHPLGMLFWVTGLRGDEVFAFMNNSDLKVDLIDSFSFRLTNGAIGTIGSHGGATPEQTLDQTLIYYGSKGFIRQDIIHGKLSMHLKNGEVEDFPDLELDEVYKSYLPVRSFVDLIAGEGENKSPGWVGARAIEFLEAGCKSAHTNQSVKIII